MKKWNSFSSFTRRVIVTAVVVPALALLVSAALPISFYEISSSGHILRVDRDNCVGCGVCVEETHAFFIDDDGKIRVIPEMLGLDNARTAAAVCPADVFMIINPK